MWLELDQIEPKPKLQEIKPTKKQLEQQKINYETELLLLINLLKTFWVEFISEDDKITFKFPKKIILSDSKAKWEDEDEELETKIEGKPEVIEWVKSFLINNEKEIILPAINRDWTFNLNKNISISIFLNDGTINHFDFEKRGRELKVYKTQEIIFKWNSYENKEVIFEWNIGIET